MPCCSYSIFELRPSGDFLYSAVFGSARKLRCWVRILVLLCRKLRWQKNRLSPFPRGRGEWLEWSAPMNYELKVVGSVPATTIFFLRNCSPCCLCAGALVKTTESENPCCVAKDIDRLKWTLQGQEVISNQTSGFRNTTKISFREGIFFFFSMRWQRWSNCAWNKKNFFYGSLNDLSLILDSCTAQPSKSFCNWWSPTETK